MDNKNTNKNTIDATLTEIMERLVKAASPRKIILFGSHARGQSTLDSDFDILVIESSVKSQFEEMVRLRRVLRGLKVPIDILVISESEFQSRSDIPSTVYYWAKKEGKVIYDAAA